MRSSVIRKLSGVLFAAFLVSLPSTASAQVLEDVQQRMVKIYGAGGLKNLHAYSTGFLISPEGHIATVWSYVLDANVVTVVLRDGRRFDARVLGAEPQLDLAILKLEGDELDLPHFNLDDAVEVEPGTRVFAFSNMFKVAGGDEPVTVQHGVIAAKTELTTRRGAFETPFEGAVYVVDAITNNPGAGGGVLTTHDGRLIGMIGKELRNAESNTWVNYAIPINAFQDVTREIITGRYIARETSANESDSDGLFTALDFGIVTVPDVLMRTPAYVDSVLPDSAAAEAGLRRNDLVMFVNDDLVQSCRELRTALGRLETGDTLRLVVRREDQLIPLTLTVPAKAVP